jgi:hypothetical protein
VAVCNLTGQTPQRIGKDGVPEDPDPRKAAQQLWQKTLAKCGDSYYYRYDDGELLRLKDASFDVLQDPLSRADQANGVQWRGYALVGSILEKSWTRPPGLFLGWEEPPKEWNKWKDGTDLNQLKKDLNRGFPPDMAPTIIRMTRSNGRWEFESHHISKGWEPYDPGSGHRIECSAIPPDQPAPKTGAVAPKECGFTKEQLDKGGLLIPGENGVCGDFALGPGGTRIRLRPEVPAPAKKQL